MITRLLIGANALVYVWEVLTGAQNSNVTLYNHGALVPAAVLQDHQWWRLISGGFMHLGLLHIGVNMFSLYMLGRFIELILGSPRMFVVYMVSLIGSGLAVTYFAPPLSVTVGASGAIFGLFGALFAIGLKLGERGRDLVRANIGILILNLIITFSVPIISWQGHIGGLITGFLLTLVLFWPPRPVRTRAYDPNTGAVYESQLES
ncbi:MAG TPA: rhomboid family intramembrane serine protease [Candidatus Rubrimentiphilum sp.]|nr:rhomboid family intramembrane serine protease [Candidatus Rubrimentiphilum sp.]